MLLGGIDLDPSDRVLGLLLVSELQHRRRQRHVLKALLEANVRKQQEPPGLLTRALSTLSHGGRRRRASGSLDPSGQSSPGFTLHGSGSSQAISGSSSLPAPLAAASNGKGAVGATSWSSPAKPPAARPMYRHDFLRLKTLRQRGDAEEGGSAAEETGGLADPAPQLASLGERGGDDAGSPTQPSSPQLRLDSQYQPMLAPSGCAQCLDPPISPQQAAEIYTGHHEAVDAETLGWAWVRVCGGLGAGVGVGGGHRRGCELPRRMLQRPAQAAGSSPPKASATV